VDLLFTYFLANYFVVFVKDYYGLEEVENLLCSFLKNRYFVFLLMIFIFPFGQKYLLIE
jgi:hypothetical protein